MESQDALKFINDVLRENEKPVLDNVEECLFLGIWEGLEYQQIVAKLNLSNQYTRELGSKLFKKLKEELGILVSKKNFQNPIKHFYQEYSSNSLPIKTPTPNPIPSNNQNPFIPTTGRIENPEKLFGREQELTQIFELLNNSSSVAIIGEPAIGKSSFLYAVCQQSEKFLKIPRQNVFLDMNNIYDQEDFYFAICEKLDIPESKGYRFTRNLENKRVLLILDNVGKLNGTGFTRDVRDHLRGLAEGSNACLKLVVAANEPLKTLFKDSQSNGNTSPLENIFQQIDIFPWDETVIHDFITKHSLLYGEEMYILAETLVAFNDAKELKSIANLQLPIFPTSGLLRPHTWQTLNRFLRVIEDVKIINCSVSHVSRSSALNRVLGELTTILNTADTLPTAEKGLIIDIAENWRQQLLRIAGEVGEVVINKSVNNPYVIGDPVIGNLFIGREDIIRQLEELWLRGIQIQSVVIYGHRRMGKTSILRNAANSLDNQVKVADVNLLKLGDVTQGVGEVLMAISDEISQVVNIPTPNDDDLLKLPERTFNRYFEKVIKNLSGGLIIAIDEFEKIEDLIKEKKIPNNFMDLLRGLLQTSPQVAFAFAGLHTLDEMTADYFHPFFGSVINIRVGFLSPGATGQILANPAIEDFLLDYTPAALDKIYDLTHGQPYLVRLVGFHLVRLYNDFVFEQGKDRDHVFTVEDVETVVSKPEFFTRCSNYFNGVWGQAGENDNTQQIILRELAQNIEGLTVNELVELTGIDESQLNAALEILNRHDVIVENQSRWRIIVELFRRWVEKSHP
ncbi:ATP-binding protein [Okeanomitos corallinicola TIOX110]|uniref:ATP-binding protein n=1 Tax=Okeanomitos corallinicola TIOX110 TaxID=3133117 RepID=A0ABZ2UMX3_9CYAN